MKVMKTKKVRIVGLMLVFAMLFSYMGVFAEESGTADKNSNELVYEMTPYNGDTTDFLKFDSVDEFEDFLSAFYIALDNPVEIYESAEPRISCVSNPNQRYTYKTTHRMVDVVPAAWTFSLTTHYYVYCSSDYVTFPHSPTCKNISDTYNSLTRSGVTAGVFFEDETIETRVYSDNRGFETFADGTAVLGVDIGGVGNLISAPYSISHSKKIT